jgi:DNA gyrase subunit B/topoisomerase-4 subunit B
VPGCKATLVADYMAAVPHALDRGDLVKSVKSVWPWALENEQACADAVGGVGKSARSPHRDRWPKAHTNGRGSPEITRFKGRGEMMPKVLWETTLSPKTRRLLRVEIADQLVTDRVINELMGKDASARFRFIMERAEDAQERDV